MILENICAVEDFLEEKEFRYKKDGATKNKYTINSTVSFKKSRYNTPLIFEIEDSSITIQGDMDLEHEASDENIEKIAKIAALLNEKLDCPNCYCTPGLLGNEKIKVPSYNFCKKIKFEKAPSFKELDEALCDISRFLNGVYDWIDGFIAGQIDIAEVEKQIESNLKSLITR